MRWKIQLAEHKRGGGGVDVESYHSIIVPMKAAVAARLHLTQPAVSQALKRLEDTLGRNLIQRRGPHFEPTRAGEEVYRIASDIDGHMSRLETELDVRARTSLVRSGC